jgi:hypothetical protein
MVEGWEWQFLWSNSPCWEVVPLGEKVSNMHLFSGFHSSSTIEGLMCGSPGRMTNTYVISTTFHGKLWHGDGNERVTDKKKSQDQTKLFVDLLAKYVHIFEQISIQSTL